MDRKRYLSNIARKVSGEFGGKVWFSTDKDGLIDASIDEAKYITFASLEDSFNYKTIKILKNYSKMDMQYFAEKINPKNNYIPIVNKVRELLNSNGCTGLAIYPTSYGFGVDTFCSKDEFRSRNEIIESILKKFNLKYSVEFSDAGWVFRYKLSKSKDNLNSLFSIV